MNRKVVERALGAALAQDPTTKEKVSKWLDLLEKNPMASFGVAVGHASHQPDVQMPGVVSGILLGIAIMECQSLPDFERMLDFGEKMSERRKAILKRRLEDHSKT